MPQKRFVRATAIRLLIPECVQVPPCNLTTSLGIFFARLAFGHGDIIVLKFSNLFTNLRDMQQWMVLIVAKFLKFFVQFSVGRNIPMGMGISCSTLHCYQYAYRRRFKKISKSLWRRCKPLHAF